MALYVGYWAPIEVHAAEAARNSKRSMSELLNGFIAAFVAQLPVEDESALYSNNAAASSTEPGAVETNPKAWFDPGLMLFPMYKALKQCIDTALKKRGLPIVMREPTKGSERVILSILGEMKIFGQRYWGEMVGTASYATNSSHEDTPCACYSRGTLCTACIVKKCAAK